MADSSASSETAPANGFVQAVADAIAAYLQQHPRSADTAQGIRQWWLAGSGIAASAEDVEQALGQLHDARIVEPFRAGTRTCWRRHTGTR